MIIGSFPSFFALVKRKPELFNIPTLKSLQQHVDAFNVATRGRTCGACAMSGINLDPYRRAFEEVFERLSGEDLAEMKKLLKTPKIEYYVKNPVTKLTEVRTK